MHKCGDLAAMATTPSESPSKLPTMTTAAPTTSIIKTAINSPVEIAAAKAPGVMRVVAESASTKHMGMEVT